MDTLRYVWIVKLVILLNHDNVSDMQIQMMIFSEFTHNWRAFSLGWNGISFQNEFAGLLEAAGSQGGMWRELSDLDQDHPK